MINPQSPRVIGVARNMSGVQAGRKLRLKSALIVDAVHLMYETIQDLSAFEQVVITPKAIFCNTTDNWNSGQTVMNYMKGVNNYYRTRCSNSSLRYSVL